MKNRRIPSLTKTSLFHLGCALLLGSSLLTSLHAKEFTPEPPKVVLDFTSLTNGTPVTDLTGWSGSSAVVGTTPRSAGQNPRSIVLSTASASNQFVTAPAQTVPPPLLAGDTVYFSAWFNWSGSNSSNVRIFLENGDGVSLGAFGLASREIGMADANGIWTYSDLSITAHQWYELTLVVDLQPDNLAASLGYLYIRPANSGAAFELLSGFENGILMGYGDNLNATHFAHWRLQLRNEAQLDHLTIGVGTLQIPEPGSVALLAGAVTLLIAHRFARRSPVA